MDRLCALSFSFQKSAHYFSADHHDHQMNESNKSIFSFYHFLYNKWCVFQFRWWSGGYKWRWSSSVVHKQKTVSSLSSLFCLFGMHFAPRGEQNKISSSFWLVFSSIMFVLRRMIERKYSNFPWKIFYFWL